MARPQGWKNYEDFAAGIDANRLPGFHGLTGTKWLLDVESNPPLELSFQSSNALNWKSGSEQGAGDWYEAIQIAADTYFLDITFASKPLEALTLLVNTATKRVLSIRS